MRARGGKSGDYMSVTCSTSKGTCIPTVFIRVHSWFNLIRLLNLELLTLDGRPQGTPLRGCW